MHSETFLKLTSNEMSLLYFEIVCACRRYLKNKKQFCLFDPVIHMMQRKNDPFEPDKQIGCRVTINTDHYT